MPPKARGCAPASVVTPGDDFEGLTDEEVQFCWLSLVESTQLTAAKLQEFMYMITGEKLSAVQAKDLLKYMDANEDGVVGREDFKHFISVGRLKDTNAKDMMWTPKRKYREEHGTDKQQKDKDRDEDLFSGNLPFSSLRGSIAEADTRRGSLEVPGTSEMPSFGAGNRGSTVSVEGGKEPRPPLGSKRRGHDPRSTRAEDREKDKKLQQEAQNLFESAPKLEQEAAKKVTSAKVDEKVKRQIDDSISRYEQKSWERFLQMEEEFKEQMFKQFAADGQGMEATEYHRMLLKYHKLAKWCMPGDLRAGDSLAAMKYILDQDRLAQRKSVSAAPSAAGVPPAAAEGASPAAAAGVAGEGDGGEAEARESDLEMPADARLTYQMWIDLMNGKFRPEESSGRS